MNHWASRFARPIASTASTLFQHLAEMTAQEWLLLLLAAVLVAVLFSFSLFMLSNRRLRRRKDREVANMVSRFVDERDKSEAILTDLDVGILAYSSDGVLINSNPAAKRMISPQPVPEKIVDFMHAFGQDNGLQASFLLGTAQASGKFSLDDRILRARYKESRVDEGRVAGTIVVLQDITDSEREDKQRKDFVANVSHELKTPLTTIKTYSESLLEWGLAEKTPEAIRKDIWRIHDDSLRMERLVEDLLLLSSIDSRGIRIRMEQLDFSKLIRQSVDRLMHQALEKQIDMTCYTVARTPFVYVDRIAIDRVMSNLLSNAIKYTDRGGEIKVYIGYLVDDVYVKVSDTGFGIDREHLSRIFNRFYRVDMTGSRMYGGTGLGLSIAKELVELHEGRITVSSTLGKGTEFTVMIPIAKKVFTDTVEACQSGWPRSDVLHQSAVNDLQQLAIELGFIKEQICEMDTDKWQTLLDKALDHEQPLEPQAATEPVVGQTIEELKGETVWPAI